MIRNYISSGVPKEQIKNVYIPDIFGKEKRKDTPSKEGKLGVEGMTKEVILASLEKQVFRQLLPYVTILLPPLIFTI